MLDEVAVPVDEVTDDIRRLVDRMIDVMIEHNGIGLAAPQIGIGLRIFVVSVDGTRENAKVYINPELEVSGTQEANEEGCLSVPGVFAKIKRYRKCVITATDLEEKRFTQEANGLQVRAFQHEYDHLEGTLIKDRMGQVQLIAARRQLRELRERYEKDK